MDIVSFCLGIAANSEGGGGGNKSSYELIASQSFEVNTTTTSTNVNVGTINLGETAWTKDKILYVKIRGTKGKVAGSWYGCDAIVFGFHAAKEEQVADSYIWKFSRAPTSTGWMALVGYSTCYGVFPNTLYPDGRLQIYARYNSNYGDINDTYTVDVYLLSSPDGLSLCP